MKVYGIRFGVHMGGKAIFKDERFILFDILKKRFRFDDEQADRTLKIHSVDKVKQEIKDALLLGIEAHEVLLNRLWIAYNLTEEKTMDKYLKAL